MRSILSILLFAFIGMVSNAQSPYYLLWDHHHSANAGGQNLLTVHRAINDFTGSYLPTRWQDENTFGRKIGGIGYRLAKTILLDYQLDHLVHLAQHEIFGHGYQYRLLDYEKNKYHIDLFPPFGGAGGLAQRGSRKSNRINGQHEEIAVRYGGTEAAQVLSQQLKTKWVLRQRIHYREPLLYLSNFLDFSVYALTTSKTSNPSSSNDINNVVRLFNKYNGITDPAAYTITVDDLANSGIANFMNTYAWLSLYGFCRNYLLAGEEEWRLPMFKHGDLRWLPAIRLILTPYGTEGVVEGQMLTGNGQFWEAQLRLGDGRERPSWTLGGRHIRTFSDRLHMRFQAQVWDQPGLELGGRFLDRTAGGIGGLGLVAIDLAFGKVRQGGFYLEAGYKTSGYAEGEPLKAGGILRMGLSFWPAGVGEK